jgi:hypothetical protein
MHRLLESQVQRIHAIVTILSRLEGRIAALEDRLIATDVGGQKTESGTGSISGSTCERTVCPACGKKVGMTPAERQRRYRERKKRA